MTQHLITFMIVLPLIGALFQALLPQSREVDASRGGVSRWVALAASVGSSLFTVALLFSMNSQSPDLQNVEILPWVGSYAISYELGVDGLNVLLVLLVGLIFPLLIAEEWEQKVGSRGMHGLFLLLQSAFVGALCAQDLFLQFFFWSLSSLPFYFLVSIWGGKGRETAAFRLAVASSLGNALLFAALVLIYYSVDPHSFSIRELAGGKLGGKVFPLFGQELPVHSVAFGLICASLALRAPIWPLHGWFTETAEEASPSVFVALSAVSVPVATYIFIRLGYSLFPETIVTAAGAIVVVGAINLVMGGICALGQTSLSSLMAFICLSQVGLMLIGIGSLNSAGVVGAVYQQLSLGLGLAGFGLFSGLIAERTGQSNFISNDGTSRLGGVATQAPMIALVAGVVVASLLGFPGLGGFVSGALLTLGSYSVSPAVVLLIVGSLLLSTYYLFNMYRSVFLGPISAEGNGRFPELNLREKAYFVPILGGLVAFGVYPKPWLDLVKPTILTLLSTLK